MLTIKKIVAFVFALALELEINASLCNLEFLWIATAFSLDFLLLRVGHFETDEGIYITTIESAPANPKVLHHSLLTTIIKYAHVLKQRGTCTNTSRGLGKLDVNEVNHRAPIQIALPIRSDPVVPLPISRALILLRSQSIVNVLSRVNVNRC